MPQKKNFKDNPALQFISATPNFETEAEEIPNDSKRNPEYVETRSKRLNLLIQPSLHEKLKAIAESRKISINELIHTALEKYVET